MKSFSRISSQNLDLFILPFVIVDVVNAIKEQRFVDLDPLRLQPLQQAGVQRLRTILRGGVVLTHVEVGVKLVPTSRDPHIQLKIEAGIKGQKAEMSEER